MGQRCRVIELEGLKVIMCGGEPSDHKCNEDALCFDLVSGERKIFTDSEKANKWYAENYEKVTGGSVACTICGRAAADNMMFDI